MFRSFERSLTVAKKGDTIACARVGDWLSTHRGGTGNGVPAFCAAASAGKRHDTPRVFTLVERMIAVTLVAAILTGLLMAMRTSLTAYQKVSTRLEDNRRAMG